MELKVAVIGCGGRGRGHVKTLAQFPDVDLVAVCDPIEESRQNVINEHQISKGFSDLATMLDSETLDAVWVAPPEYGGGTPLSGSRGQHPDGIATWVKYRTGTETARRGKKNRC